MDLFFKKPSIDEIWDRPLWSVNKNMDSESFPWTNFPTLGRLFGGTYFTSLSSGCCEVDEGRQQRMGKIRPQRGVFAAFLSWIDESCWEEQPRKGKNVLIEMRRSPWKLTWQREHPPWMSRCISLSKMVIFPMSCLFSGYATCVPQDPSIKLRTTML